ncbi:transmembrane protein, putative (macronuclear) [Tetrahymena thermophila SB210]|uniref:Transmembrane protein, putative n=1 Tax=Tetrahymena thermophila (strain SB210) TaxID=312017 RepID=Q22MQ3_TETTS|nr:transmembrane protein, putative [Tetrahymena thermophila SB210]EAR86334.2 transmembrane protein, putative [Tetrahymena thermophila SB210]|eukprot:XP_976967.2 transmembrane protein, putative [Tetrahymena thermophila SB210]
MIIPDYSNNNRNNQQQREDDQGNLNQENIIRQSRRIGTYARQQSNRNQIIDGENQQNQSFLTEEQLQKRKELKQSILRGIICFLIPLCMFGLYAIFLKSYFTAFYILFAGLLIIFTLESFYVSPQMPQTDNKNDNEISLLNEEKVQLLDFRIYLWIIGTFATASVLIFKLFMITYYNVHNEMPFKASYNIMYDLEIYIVDKGGQNWSNILKMFLPTSLVLINCIIVFIFRVPRKSLKFQDIKLHKKRNNLINFCKTLVWTCLVAVQSFNVTLQAYIFYFIFFLSLSSLFFSSKIKNFLDEYIKHLIKLICLGVLMLQFLCSTKSFRDSIQGQEWSFELFGLNYISDFKDELTYTPLYFISMWCLLIITVLCANLIKFERLVLKVREISEEYQKKYGGNLPELSYEHSSSNEIVILSSDNEVNSNQLKSNDVDPAQSSSSDSDSSSDEEDDTAQQLQQQQDIRNQSKRVESIQIRQERGISLQPIKNFSNSQQQQVAFDGQEIQVQPENQLEQQLLQQEQNIQQEPTIEQHQKDSQLKEENSSKTEKAVKKMKTLGNKIMLKLLKFKRNFKSDTFMLRILQIVCIFLVQRYFTYYSLGLMTWVLLTGFTINHRFTIVTSFVFAIPSLVLIYVFTVFSNISNNPFIPSWANSQLGFQTCYTPWLEVIILNSGLFLYFFYCQQALQSFKQKKKEKEKKKTGVKFGTKYIKRTKSQIKKKKQKNKEISYFVILQAFILKYSYLLALFMIYWISFQAINLAHVILVGLFLIFFSNMNTTIQIPRQKKSDSKKGTSDRRSQSGEQVMPTPRGIRTFDVTPQNVNQAETLQNPFNILDSDRTNKLKSDNVDASDFNLTKAGRGSQTVIPRSKKFKQVTFGRRYWILMVIYVEIYLIARYIYFLIFQDQFAEDSFCYSLFNFIGISQPYNFPIHLGLSHQDPADESIVWILFYFIILQYDSYKSKIYMKYSHKITEIFAKKALIKKVFPNFISYVSSFYIVFYSILIWVSFIVISGVLILVDFSFINTYLLVYILLLVIYFVKKNANKKLNYVVFQRTWYFFTLNLIIVSFTRYFLQLTSVQFVSDEIINENNSWFKTFQRNRSVYGFYSDNPDDNLRMKFLPGIINIFFAVLCLDYFRLISEGYKFSRELERKRIANQGAQDRIRENSVSSYGGAASSRKNSDISIASSMFDDGEIIESRIEKQKALETLKMYQDYVQVDILLKYKWMTIPAKWISLLFTDVLCFLVIIFCIYFKISLSMLYFLAIYLFFYFKTHSHILNYIEANRFFEIISEKMLLFQEKYLRINKAPDNILNDKQQAEGTPIQQQKEDLKESNEYIQKQNRSFTQKQSEEDQLDEEFVKKINRISLISLEIKIREKEKVWNYSFYGSMIFLMITYFSQFLLTSFALTNVGTQICYWIQWGMFIFGTQITVIDDIENTWRNIYFYVLLFWLNVLDLKCLRYLQSIIFEKENEIQRETNDQDNQQNAVQVETDKLLEQNADNQQEQEEVKDQSEYTPSSKDDISLKKVVSQYLGNKKELEEISEEIEEEQANFIDKKLVRSNKVARMSLEIFAQDFEIDLNESEFKERMAEINKIHFYTQGAESENLFKYAITQQNKEQKDPFKETYSINNKSFSEETIIEYAEYINIAYYFKSKKNFIEMRIFYSTLFIIQRIYVLILLFDSNSKQNAFSWIYLILAAYFWVRTPKSSTIRALNRWTIFVLLLQYIFLLLNINLKTSLIPIPSYLWNLKNMSVIDNILSDTQIQSYLAFDNSDNVALLLNALIIFLIEIYFMYFVFICKFIMQRIRDRRSLSSLISQKVWINFRAWKSSYISFITTVYEGLLINFHLIVIIICIILSCFSYEIFNLLITTVCLSYFFYYEFKSNKDIMSEKIPSILLFFKILRIFVFLLLVVYTVLKVPQIDNFINTDDTNLSYFRQLLKQEVISFHISEKVFILFFIQLVFDIMLSKDFKEFLKTYQLTNQVKQRLRRKCIAYQFNNEKLKKIEKRLQENKELIRNVQEVQNQLDNWHATIDMKSNKPNGKINSTMYEPDEKRSTSSLNLNEQVVKAKQIEAAKKKEESQSNLDTFFTPEELEREKEKKSIPQFKRYLRKFATLFKGMRNEFIFQDELGMLDFVIKNNPYLLECIKINLIEYLTGDLVAIQAILDFLDNLYANIFLKIRTQSIDEFNPDKLKRNLQRAASANPDILSDFQFLKRNNSMKPNEIELFRKESEIYSNYDRVLLFDSNQRFKFFNLDEERWFKEKNKGRDTYITCILKYLGQILISGWSYICYIFFIFYYFKNNGLTSMFFPLFVFLYFMVEEKIGEMLIWEISFFYISILIIFKFVNSLSGLIQQSDQSSPSDYNITVFFDSNDSLFFEGFLYFLIYIQLNLIRRMGLDKKMINQEENTHMSYVRLKVNKFIKTEIQPKIQRKDLNDDFFEINEEDSNLEYDTDLQDAEAESRKSSNFVLLQKSLPESLLQVQVDNFEQGEKDESRLIEQEDLKKIQEENIKSQQSKETPQQKDYIKESMIRTDQSNTSESDFSINSIESEFTQEGFYKQLEEEISEKPDLIDPEVKTNFFFRLFSKYTKKSGVDLYPSIALIQVILLIYIFLFYNEMQNGQQDLSSSLKYNQFSGSMVIFMIIQIVFMVWERYITLYTSEEVKDKEVERIKLIVKARSQGLAYSKNLKNLKALQKEITELERLKKEEEQFQKDLQSSNIRDQKQLQDLKKGQKGNQDQSEEDKKKEKGKQFKFSQILMKYIQLFMIVVLFTYFIFFFIPQPFFKTISGSIDWTHYQTNGYLGGLYFFFGIYLVLSCFQIKIGYNQFKIRNTILTKKNILTGICAKSFRAIPFIQELKVVMDWTFTATTLDLFQWFKIEDIHFYLFCAKVDANDNKKKPVGMPQNWIMKFFMGWVFLLAILLLLFGPMILFSSLNPSTQLNNITNASFEMGLQINGQSGNYYQFYQNGNIGNLKSVASSSTNMDIYQNITAISQASPSQFQQFSLYSSSDVNWQLSVPSITEIQQTLENQIQGRTNIQIQFSVRYNIQRNVTSLSSQDNTFLYPINTQNIYDKSTSLTQEQVAQLLVVMDDCNSQAMELPNFYISLLRLDTNGDSFEARTFSNLSPSQQIAYFKSAYLNLKCKLNPDQTYDENIRYWVLSLDQNGQNGLIFYVLCDKYSSVLQGLSIITIYTSVILVIGKLIKSVFSGDIQLLMFTDQPHSDKLIKICDAIAYSRTERDLIKENLLYWELIDLMRSPEVVKMLTGSYSKAIINKRKKELEEAEREEERKLKKEQ